uniref:Arrestin C-terminal-like domain-containing protein n=1 Tax=Pectinophora gossypiella TaxID=13191 RepID=A0A1E1WJ31_PECGO
MSWESCIILLNSDSTGSFYCGDIVTGSVVIEFKKKQKVEHITFTVYGTSKAQWSRSMPVMPYLKMYSEKNTILEYELDVFSELDGKTISPGIQTFHFHFVIPDDAPSTFKSSIAEVKYFIKVEGKADCKFKKLKIVPFVVQGNINLNHLEEYLIPTFHETKKTLWGSGFFSICFKTYIGFSSRQYIPFEAIITNEKKVKISKIIVSLIQKLEYSVSSGYANEEKHINKIEHKRFSHTVTEMCHFGMEIPQTIPSSIHLTNPTVDISYVLRVSIFHVFYDVSHQ